MLDQELLDILRCPACVREKDGSLDFYRQAEIDVLIGIDPVQGTHTDMRLMKEKIGDRVCLWGDFRRRQVD